MSVKKAIGRRGRKQGVGKLRRKLGYRPSQLWFLPWQLDLVKEAARIEKRPVTVFTVVAALAAARKILAKQKDS